ncbi:hypothetical protein BH24ACT3_BH24ACT3_07250 [soil metagenome]
MFPTKQPIARVGAALALMLGLALAVTAPASAQAPTPATAVSYINPDNGLATANPDVDPASGCGDVDGEAPDKDDTQPVVTDPMTDNVHTDACIFDDLWRGLRPEHRPLPRQRHRLRHPGDVSGS